VSRARVCRADGHASRAFVRHPRAIDRSIDREARRGEARRGDVKPIDRSIDVKPIDVKPTDRSM